MRQLFHLSFGPTNGRQCSAKPDRTPQKPCVTARSTLTVPSFLSRLLLASSNKLRYAADIGEEPLSSLQMNTLSPSPTLHSCRSRHVYTRSSRVFGSVPSAAAARRRSVPNSPLEMTARRIHSPKFQVRQTSEASTQYSPHAMGSSPESVLPQEVRWEQAVAAATATIPDSPEPHITPSISSSTSTFNSSKQSSLPSTAMNPPSRTSPPSSTTSSTHRAPSSSATAATTLVGTTASSSSSTTTDLPQPSRSKRPRHSPSSTTKIVPSRYQHCDPSDLVKLIANMLMELISHNDSTTASLSTAGLTRFHSRAPPGISVADYLQRLTTHATLSPPILLCMVYYIDRLCALWPRFTINSLTVHRYLIASATVASKGLSDSFWTNNTYARVGGVGLRELAVLELEFLQRIDWRIVPKPEVLVDYYRSLVARSEGFEIRQSVPRRVSRDSQGSGRGFAGSDRGKRQGSRGSGGGRGSDSGSGGDGEGGKSEEDERMETETETETESVLSSGEIMAQEDAKRRVAVEAGSSGPSQVVETEAESNR